MAVFNVRVSNMSDRRATKGFSEATHLIQMIMEPLVELLLVDSPIAVSVCLVRFTLDRDFWSWGWMGWMAKHISFRNANKCEH